MEYAKLTNDFEDCEKTSLFQIWLRCRAAQNRALYSGLQYNLVNCNATIRINCYGDEQEKLELQVALSTYVNGQFVTLSTVKLVYGHH